MWRRTVALLSMAGLFVPGIAIASDGAAKEFIKEHDRDHDGRLSFAEFPCPSDASGDCDAAAMTLTWELYDRNGDGFVTAREFMRVNKQRKN